MGRLAFVLCILGLWAPPAATQTPSWAADRAFSYTFDVREAVEGADGLGLDFDLRYEVQREALGGDAQGTQLGFNVALRGFQDFDPEVSELDHMVLETSLLGRSYRSEALPLAPQAQLRQLELLALQGEGEELSASEQRELNRLTERLFSNRRFFTYGGHYRLEASQDVETRQHVVGLHVSGEVPLLHEALDLVAAATRTQDEGFRPQPIRFYTAFDYVADLTDTTTDGMSADDYPRLRLEAAWRTAIFHGLVLRATGQVHYLFDAPPEIVGDESLKVFVQAWFVYPLTEEIGIIATYAAGTLSPLYESTDAGALGLSISLGFPR